MNGLGYDEYVNPGQAAFWVARCPRARRGFPAVRATPDTESRGGSPVIWSARAVRLADPHRGNRRVGRLQPRAGARGRARHRPHRSGGRLRGAGRPGRHTPTCCGGGGTRRCACVGADRRDAHGFHRAGGGRRRAAAARAAAARPAGPRGSGADTAADGGRSRFCAALLRLSARHRISLGDQQQRQRHREEEGARARQRRRGGRGGCAGGGAGAAAPEREEARVRRRVHGYERRGRPRLGRAAGRSAGRRRRWPRIGVPEIRASPARRPGKRPPRRRA